jgi:dTDP-4-dehydrorhamnose reductase
MKSELKFRSIVYSGKFYIEVEKIWDDGECSVYTFKDSIANIVNMTVEQYLEIMIKKYNGHLDKNLNVYFNTEKITKNAISYLESIVILNKLTEEQSE